MLSVTFDLRFENKLIKELAEDAYQQCQYHADRRHMEKDFVVEKFISEFSKLARKDGLIK